MPEVPEPSEPDQIRVGLVAGVVTVVLAALVYAVAVPGGAPDAEEASADLESITRNEDDQPPGVARDESSDGGELVIVEEGFTPLKDLVGDDMVSWAVVVENTSTEMPARASVGMTVRHSDGEVLTGDDAWDVGLPTPIIPPGGSVTLGSTDYAYGETEDVTFALTDEQWFPADTPGLHVGVLTTSEYEVDWVGAGEKDNYWSDDGISFPVDEKGDMRVTFRVESTYEIILGDPSVSVVFRDEDGRLVGASRPAEYHDGSLPPGWAERTLTVDDAPSLAVEGGDIEVWAYAVKLY